MSDLPVNDQFVEVNGNTYNRMLVEQFVRDIEIAHAINPNSWCIHSADGAPYVGVGFINTLSFQGPSKTYSYLISIEDVSEQFLDQAKPFFDQNRKYFDRPWAQNLRLSDEAVSQYSDLFAEAHEKAVSRLASDVTHRANRWKWHIDSFRTSLNDALGIAIPEPGYLEELKAEHAPSESAMQPDHARFLEQMARSILAADELGNKCWSVFPTAGSMALNVGQERVGGTVKPGYYEFVVDPSALSLEYAERLAPFRIEGKNPKDYSDLYFLRLPYDGTPWDFESLHDAHVAALIRLTDPYKRATLWRSHREDFRMVVEKATGISLPVPGYVSKPSTPDPLILIRAQFAASGLHYSSAQIATFYTSLQTKGFVVLSGISGTGKSKIATGFVDMLPTGVQSSSEAVAEDDALIPIVVNPTTKKYGLVNFPIKRIEAFPTPAPGEGRRVRVSYRGTHRDCLFRHLTENGNLYRLFFSGEVRKQLVVLPIGETLYFKTIVDEESLEITGFEILLEEDLKLRQDLGSNQSDLQQDAETNHLFLSVRPDWRDSTSLLGYYNPLTQTYEWTEFLHFLIRAQKSFDAKDDLAWFVILDEMNLAHVEYYFADLLSVIESGRDDAGWTREPLRMTYPETLDDEVPPRELKLPPNLYIIGTVNMDETTHAFSPKVLDRAFAIELAEVDFSNYPIASAGSAAATLTDVQKVALLAQFTREGRFALIDKVEIGEVVARHPRIRDDLQALNELLQPHRMHFGYRVFDEICQYLHNNDSNEMMPFDDAFDQAVFMKVLPKFTGSRARLQSPLHGVLAWAIDPGQTSRDDVERVVMEFNQFYQAKASEAWTMAGAPAFPTVAGRVRDMLVALERDGFVSFG